MYSSKRCSSAATYFEACQHARDMGYDGIEFIDLDLAFAPGEDNVESLAKHLRAHCEALDLDIPAYTVGSGLSKRPRRRAGGRACPCVPLRGYRRAAGCQGAAARCVLEVRRAARLARGRSPRSAGIRQVADYAQSLGIRTCTENHGRIMQDSDRVEYLIRAVDHPNYGWLVDMGNFLCADEEPRMPWASPRLMPCTRM